MNLSLHPESILFLTLDSCRFDSFREATLPNLKSISPLHKAQSPSYFTYGSHASFWMGFTPILRDKVPWLNPKLGKLFRMKHSLPRLMVMTHSNCTALILLKVFVVLVTTL